MADSTLPRMVQKEFETLAPVVAEGLGTMLGAKVSIDLSGGTLLDEAQFFARFEWRGIACRSRLPFASILAGLVSRPLVLRLRGSAAEPGTAQRLWAGPA